ncbi:MAG: nitrous oxide reductase accessory protein NosL [Flavobacteriales bacterium]|jgi:copper chaperone NosL|nr:nitrous oxide reductase accessory protein NosL [Flavobacteriales bacterium]
MKRSFPLLGMLIGIALFACGQPAVKIDFGQAECAHCRMNVVDKQYAAAITTVKGRQYVFDDAACMVQYVHTGTVAEDQVAAWHVCDHGAPGTLIDATTALYLHGAAFRSPMRGDVAAFATAEARDRHAAGAEQLDWNAVRAKLSQ